MKFIVIALALVCVAQARVARDAGAAGTENIDTLINNFKEAFEQTSKSVNEALGIKNSDEIINNVKSTANTIAGNMNEFMLKVKQEAEEWQKKHGPEVKSAMDAYQAKLQGLVDDFKKENPEMAASAKKIQDNLQTTMNKLVEETKNFQTTVEKDTKGIRADVDRLLKEAMAKATDAAKKLQAEIESKAKKN